MSDDQTIIRVKKDADNPFVMMDKRPLEKDYLSWKAKGLLAYLLSRPDNWKIRMGDLVKRSTDGKHATRAALEELKDAKHIKVTRRNTNDGTFDWTYTVYEQPYTDYPYMDKPSMVNRTLNNKELNNKEFNKESTTGGDTPNVFELYESNIGAMTSIIAEKLKDLEDNYSPLWVGEAIKEAVQNEARNIKYVDAILRRWRVDGFKSPRDKRKPPPRQTKKSVEEVINEVVYGS